MSLLYVPFILQGVSMAIDEVIHNKRGLASWERYGHPIDTATVALAIGFISFAEVSSGNLSLYIILCVISCLFITKDEWIHTSKCGGFEHWLHSVLFILHPISFFSAGFIWWTGYGTWFLSVLFFTVVVFMIYQIIRWSIPWKKESK